MRILIIEDEKKTSAFLQKGLSERGFFVEAAENGEDGLLSARAGNHDLIVLDVMLPGRDGWSIITELRHANLHTPVLFLTARDLVPDRVKGLELGADDYLIKPFAFSELFARIRSILKRGPVRQESTVRIGDLEIDPRLHKALRAGRGLQLTTKEFTLLVYLAQFSPDVVSRTSIAEHVWDINFDTGTNMVEAAIRRLRAKVDDSFEKKLIHTVRGIGYVLEAR
jgi:two-component system copper resistance phosphate regulon response regulator CusR